MLITDYLSLLRICTILFKLRTKCFNKHPDLLNLFSNNRLPYLLQYYGCSTIRNSTYQTPMIFSRVPLFAFKNLPCPDTLILIFFFIPSMYWNTIYTNPCPIFVQLRLGVHFVNEEKKYEKNSIDVACIPFLAHSTSSLLD